MPKRKKEQFEFESIWLDPASKIPQYLQLENQIRQAISNGRLIPGFRVPSSRSLASILSISRNTVISAYNQLTSEGYLNSAKGSGTVVSEIPPEVLEFQSVTPNSIEEEIDLSSLSLQGKQLALESDLFTTGSMQAQPFLPHVPAINDFPLEIWNRISSEQSKWSSNHLSLCEPQGYLPLRKALSSYMAISRGVSCSEDQIIITSGGQQGMALIAQMLLNPGDTVWVEEPGNSPANRILSLAGADLTGVPVDNQGIDIDKVNSKRPPKLICVTPGGQWPLGMTMSLNRRMEIHTYARKSRSWILEDDYNGEFRYSGRPLPALSSLDKTGRTIYMGTLSKLLFPSIRLAFLIVPPKLAQGFSYAKWLLDRGCPALTQKVLFHFIESGNFLKHIRQMRTLYSKRQKALYQELKKQFKGKISISLPESGMHLVAFGKTQEIESELMKSALEAKIQFHPVSVYSANPGHVSSRGLILGFAAYDIPDIKQAVKNWSKQFFS